LSVPTPRIEIPVLPPEIVGACDVIEFELIAGQSANRDRHVLYGLLTLLRGDGYLVDLRHGWR